VLDNPFALGRLGRASAAALMLDPDAHNDVSARSMLAGTVARSRFTEDRLLRDTSAADALAKRSKGLQVAGGGGRDLSAVKAR